LLLDTQEATISQFLMRMIHFMNVHLNDLLRLRININLTLLSESGLLLMKRSAPNGMRLFLRELIAE